MNGRRSSATKYLKTLANRLIIKNMSTNNIPATQDQEAQQRLLWARRELYAKGKRILTGQLALTLLVPIIGSIAAIWFPAIKPTVALVSLIIAVLDPTVLDRWQKKIRKTAAQLQEQFDCAVLQMPWDEFTAGPRVDHETIHEYSTKFDPSNPDPKLLKWYPAAVGQIPLYLGRIICQRTNLWYDGKLRRQWAGWALVLATVLSAVLLGIAMYTGLTVESFVVSVLAPASPIIIWCLREFYRQSDARQIYSITLRVLQRRCGIGREKANAQKVTVSFSRGSFRTPFSNVEATAR